MSTTEKTATAESTATAEKTANITVIQAVYGAVQGQKDVTARVRISSTAGQPPLSPTMRPSATPHKATTSILR